MHTVYLIIYMDAYELNHLCKKSYLNQESTLILLLYYLLNTFNQRIHRSQLNKKIFLFRNLNIIPCRYIPNRLSSKKFPNS